MSGQKVLCIAILVFSATVAASLSYAQTKERAAEINEIKAIVARAVKEGLPKKLDAEVAPKEVVHPGERQPIRRQWGLMVENGSLRLVNDTDRTLAPNNYLTIIYEKDYQQHSWQILGLDNQNQRQQVFSFQGRW